MVVGKITEHALSNIRQHERSTAKAIAKAGYDVEFLQVARTYNHKTPDILFDGVAWEIKSPISTKLTQIENNLKKANRQSQYIIIDSQRIKHLPDIKVQAFLRARFKIQKNILRLFFINKKRELIDIAELSK